MSNDWAKDLADAGLRAAQEKHGQPLSEAEQKKREAARPVMVRDWMDGFTFDHEAEIVCPDCDAVSPELAHIFAAAKWVEKHVQECPA